MIYFIGMKLGQVLKTKWIRWPILVFVGLNAVPTVAFGALFALPLGFTLLGFPETNWPFFEVIYWYVLALPIYAVLFHLAAKRSQLERPNPTLEGDARTGGAHPSS